MPRPPPPSEWLRLAGEALASLRARGFGDFIWSRKWQCRWKEVHSFEWCWEIRQALCRDSGRVMEGRSQRWGWSFWIWLTAQSCRGKNPRSWCLGQRVSWSWHLEERSTCEIRVWGRPLWAVVRPHAAEFTEDWPEAGLEARSAGGVFLWWQ